MKALHLALTSLLFVTPLLSAQKLVKIPLGGGQGELQADLYGSGTRGVILAHGAVFNKESWKTQAEGFAESGFLVLAISFQSESPSSTHSRDDSAGDVLAAASYLRLLGATSVSAVGASLGGEAVGNANARSTPGTFDSTVLLASTGGDSPGRLNGRKLFIFARKDGGASAYAHAYEQAPQLKQLVLVDGSAHAQFLFSTPQGEMVFEAIREFLLNPQKTN